MGKYIIKRLLQTIPLLLVISFIVFFLIHIAPYNVIDSMITPNMTDEQIDFLIEKHNLDAPFFVQYITWLKNMLMGDFGHSLMSQVSIKSELIRRLPNTFILVFPSYVTALLLSIILGLVSAANNNKLIDKLIDGIVSIGIATPTFWFGILVIYLFGYSLKLFPILGMYTIGKEGQFLDFISHFIMPYITLTWAFFPRLTRYIKSSAKDQIENDYVKTQYAYGATKREIFMRHISRNILIPIVTQIGLALPTLITGAIITETIYSWPGIGPYLMNATKALDYPVIMAILMLSATLVILGNLLSDILYSIVDPRIRQ